MKRCQGCEGHTLSQPCLVLFISLNCRRSGQTFSCLGQLGQSQEVNFSKEAKETACSHPGRKQLSPAPLASALSFQESGGTVFVPNKEDRH